MTPRPFDPDVVERLLDELRSVLARVRDMAEVTGEQLERDALVRDALERRLIRLVDIAIAINSHVASARLGRAPADYAESFADMAEVGCIERSLADDIRPSAGLRNLLVHEYGRVDLGRLAGIVPTAVDHYTAYVEQVARFLLGRSAGEEE